MNIGWGGPQESGKSYMMARELDLVLRRNVAVYEKYKLPIRKCAVMWGIRPEYLEQWGDFITQFHDIEEVTKFTETDVFVDDITTQFDQQNWRTTSMGLKSWLRADSRRGCNFYFNAQNFAEVDISFRRQTHAFYLCEKIYGPGRPTQTLPRAADWKYWFTFIRVYNVPEIEFRKDGWHQIAEGRGKTRRVKKRYYDIYDHTVVLPTSELAPLRHRRQYCEDDNCDQYGRNKSEGKLIHS